MVSYYSRKDGTIRVAQTVHNCSGQQNPCTKHIPHAEPVRLIFATVLRGNHRGEAKNEQHDGQYNFEQNQVRHNDSLSNQSMQQWAL